MPDFPWYRLRRADELERRGRPCAAARLRDEHERARYREYCHVTGQQPSPIGRFWFVTHVLNRPRTPERPNR